MVYWYPVADSSFCPSLCISEVLAHTAFASSPGGKPCGAYRICFCKGTWAKDSVGVCKGGQYRFDGWWCSPNDFKTSFRLRWGNISIEALSETSWLIASQVQYMLKFQPRVAKVVCIRIWRAEKCWIWIFQKGQRPGIICIWQWHSRLPWKKPATHRKMPMLGNLAGSYADSKLAQARGAVKQLRDEKVQKVQKGNCKMLQIDTLGSNDKTATRLEVVEACKDQTIYNVNIRLKVIPVLWDYLA